MGGKPVGGAPPSRPGPLSQKSRARSKRVAGTKSLTACAALYAGVPLRTSVPHLLTPLMHKGARSQRAGFEPARVTNAAKLFRVREGSHTPKGSFGLMRSEEPASSWISGFFRIRDDAWATGDLQCRNSPLIFSDPKGLAAERKYPFIGSAGRSAGSALMSTR